MNEGIGAISDTAAVMAQHKGLETIITGGWDLVVVVFFPLKCNLYISLA